MQVTRTTIATNTGRSDWFSGTVFVDTVGAPSDTSRLSASAVHFTPGARMAWHTPGAAPTRFMTHIAMLDVDDQGNSATWGLHVTEAEYAGAPSIEEA